MRNILTRDPQTLGLSFGIGGAILLLALTSRVGAAEKARSDDCGEGYASVCKLVETCEPKGFEANWTCKWTYTAKRYYWHSS